MSCRVWASVAIVVGLIGSAVHADDVARLYRWREPASAIKNPGPGESQVYLLVAEAGWTPSASRSQGAYTTKLLLPDGTQITHPLSPYEGPGSGLVTFQVPAEAVRNRLPSEVTLKAWLADSATGEPVSRALRATIADFPNSAGEPPPVDRRPFGWGTALSGASRILPTPSPDGTKYARVPASGDAAGFFLATTEMTNGQVAAAVPSYDPLAGRSDEFALEAPGQPALGLSPDAAGNVLAALGTATGLPFRLPTEAEWLRAARAGAATPFWWGDQASYPSGANFLGPEPALEEDSTAPSVATPGQAATFEANPWGFLHTFGNIAEWATSPSGEFVRLGGHFRIEPAVPLPSQVVADSSQFGDDPYVGLRPAFDLDANDAAPILAKRFADDPALKDVNIAFDPDSATATLNGTVPDTATRRKADDLLRGVWWLAAVVDHLTTPAVSPSSLARLGAQKGDAKTTAPLGRVMTAIPVGVTWSNPLPVTGSDWWVNIYGPDGRHEAHRLAWSRPGQSETFEAVVDRAKFPRGPVSVALSLGKAAETPTTPGVVSNLATLQLP